MKVFNKYYFDELSVLARLNPRARQFKNIHLSYSESCQRLFNAIEPESYIRPHRHSIDPKDELLVAIRGEMVIVTFDDIGEILDVVRFGSCSSSCEMVGVVEIPSCTWHTVLALESGCVLLEVKEGPFDPDRPKEFADWAPGEGDVTAWVYKENLLTRIGLSPNFRLS